MYKGNQSLSYEESFKLTFSCLFVNISSFPFDSHECKLDITIAKLTDDLSKLIMSPLHISYYNPTMFEKLSYELKIESDESKVCDYEETTYPLISMILRLKRKSLRHLTSSYYYPTGSFALLSLISYLIKPDNVSSFSPTTKFGLLLPSTCKRT